MKTQKSIPTTLWIAISGMAIFALLHLIAGFSKPIQLLAFLINLVLLIGLSKGKKWAFVFTIIASLSIPLIILTVDTSAAFFTLGLNSFVLLPLIISTKYFFSTLKEEIQT